jgi:hypothetical protein
MTVIDAIELIMKEYRDSEGENAVLPPDPVILLMPKSYCPKCDTRIHLLSGGCDFQPAHFICGSCKWVHRVGKDVEHEVVDR